MTNVKLTTKIKHEINRAIATNNMKQSANYKIKWASWLN